MPPDGCLRRWDEGYHIDLLGNVCIPRGLVSPKSRRQRRENARQGFFEKTQFDELLKHIPGNLKGFVQFGYYSGRRKGEIGSLEWSDVDIATKVIRLQPENSKTREGRVLPLDGGLWNVIAQQWTERE